MNRLVCSVLLACLFGRLCESKEAEVERLHTIREQLLETEWNSNMLDDLVAILDEADTIFKNFDALTAAQSAWVPDEVRPLRQVVDDFRAENCAKDRLALWAKATNIFSQYKQLNPFLATLKAFHYENCRVKLERQVKATSKSLGSLSSRMATFKKIIESRVGNGKSNLLYETPSKKVLIDSIITYIKNESKGKLKASIDDIKSFRREYMMAIEKFMNTVCGPMLSRLSDSLDNYQTIDADDVGLADRMDGKVLGWLEGTNICRMLAGVPQHKVLYSYLVRAHKFDRIASTLLNEDGEVLNPLVTRDFLFIAKLFHKTTGEDHWLATEAKRLLEISFYRNKCRFEHLQRVSETARLYSEYKNLREYFKHFGGLLMQNCAPEFKARVQQALEKMSKANRDKMDLLRQEVEKAQTNGDDSQVTPAISDEAFVAGLAKYLADRYMKSKTAPKPTQVQADMKKQLGSTCSDIRHNFASLTLSFQDPLEFDWVDTSHFDEPLDWFKNVAICDKLISNQIDFTDVVREISQIVTRKKEADASPKKEADASPKKEADASPKKEPDASPKKEADASTKKEGEKVADQNQEAPITNNDAQESPKAEAAIQEPEKTGGEAQTGKVESGTEEAMKVENGAQKAPSTEGETSGAQKPESEVEKAAETGGEIQEVKTENVVQDASTAEKEAKKDADGKTEAKSD